MSNIITLFGMNESQKWLAEQAWLCETFEEVSELMDAIDENMHQDLYLVMELIFLADVDNAVITQDDCIDAVDIMRKIKYELDA